MISMKTLYTARNATIAFLACLVFGVSLGMLAGWKLWKTKPVQETYAPAEKQADGSLAAEKKPDASAKPAHMIPKGGVVERIMSVDGTTRSQSGGAVGQTNGPLPGEQGNRAGATSGQKFHVDMSLVRMPNGQRRVVVSSPDADIDGALDIPVENAAPVKELHHALGVRATLSSDGTKTIGPAYDYDKGFLRVGGDLCYAKHRDINRSEWVIGASLKIRF